MKRRLKENIKIGDEVYAPRDEYKGTVVDINGDEVLVDGPFGEEYFDINDLEKLGGDYEEDETPNFFKKRFTESKRKNIIRLTESELTNLVKRLINESDPGIPPNPALVQELMDEYFYEKTSDPNIFKREASPIPGKKAYISIYGDSIGAVCFDENVMAGRYTKGFDDMYDAHQQAVKFANESRCKTKQI